MPVIIFAFIFAILTLVPTVPALALSPTSYRQPHPLNWSHGTPVGELPGWSGSFWIFTEVSNANIWNAPLTMFDRQTGDQYEYHADFEQVSAILEMGVALTERLAFSLEVPYAYRGGGFLDNLIDEFHVFIGNRRFNRQFYETNKTSYNVETNGIDAYNSDEYVLRGISNIKPKLKWWIWKWEGKSKNSCPCGFSISAQAKIPVQDKKYGGTTGETDYSGLLHFGVPLGQSSGMWMTAGLTRLSEDPAMKGWPQLRSQQMYEVSFDIEINRKWGLLLLARTQSPFLDVDRLEYYNASDDPAIIARDRAASGWNALVRWQGTQAVGARYRPTNEIQFNLWVAEDWGLGPYDAADKLYSNHAPDFNVIFQSSITW